MSIQPIKTAGQYIPVLRTADLPWWAEFVDTIPEEQIRLWAAGLRTGLEASNQYVHRIEFQQANGRWWVFAHNGMNTDDTVQSYMPANAAEHFCPTVLPDGTGS